MDDKPPFEARLDAALAMNGMSNAQFASHFGAQGQQLVGNWRKRGRIGQQSVPKVRELLSRTNIVWLQEGIGEPEQFAGVAEPSASYVSGQSQSARPNMHTLAAAVKVIEADESRHGKYRVLDYAVILWNYYERLMQGEQQVDLITEVSADKAQGGNNVKHDEAGNRTAR